MRYAFAMAVLALLIIMGGALVALARRPRPLSRLAPGTEVVVTGLPPEGETTIGVGYNDGACAVYPGARGIVISDTFGEDQDSEVRRQVMVRFDRDDLDVYPPRHLPRSVIVAPNRGDLAPIH